MKNGFVLQDLIAESKDGEWGKGEAFDGSVEMVVVRATDFEDVQFGRPEKVPVRFIPPQIAARKTLRQNDIIIETAGGGKDRPTGRTQLLRQEFCSRSPLPITCASFCRFIRIDERKADPLFVYWLLQGMYAAGVMMQFHTQHTGVARFQYTTFATSQRFSLPTRETQRKIASILSAYDDLIENNTRRIAILEAMAQALYREWFVEFRFPGHEKVKLVDSPLGKIPEGWKRAKLKDVCDSVNYGYTASANKDVEVGPRFLRITDIVPDTIDWENVPYCEVDEDDSVKYALSEGDIVIARTGATTGYAKRLHKRHPKSVFASYLVRIVPNEAMGKHYIGLIVESDDYKAFIKRNLGGAAQPQANAQVLTSLDVLVPSPDVVAAFDRHVEPLADQKEILQVKNRNLRKTRDLLLPKLISGQLDVEEFDIEMGESLAETTA